MSEENKNPQEDEKKDINFDDDKEPIESIEKTVEDLKRKIQELSEENEQADAEKDNINGDAAKEKISETLDSTAKKVADGLNELKEKAKDAANSEETRKSIAYIKTNAVKAMDAARTTIHSLKNDPNLQAAGNKAVDSVSKFADAAKNKGEEMYGHLDDQTKSNIEDVCNKVSDSVKEGIKTVDEYMSRPEVQKKISEVKMTAIDLTQKSVEKVKNLLDGSKK